VQLSTVHCQLSTAIQPSKPTSATLQNYQGIGVPEASLAVILQGDGDELLPPLSSQPLYSPPVSNSIDIKQLGCNKSGKT
jgi:hypothetical protein